MWSFAQVGMAPRYRTLSIGLMPSLKLPGATAVATGFYKDLEGSVWLKGLVKSGVVGLPVFTLPAGYRPLEDLVFDAHVESSTSSILGAVVVKSTGDVVVSIGDNALVSLNGINFRGEH